VPGVVDFLGGKVAERSATFCREVEVLTVFYFNGRRMIGMLVLLGGEYFFRLLGREVPGGWERLSGTGLAPVLEVSRGDIPDSEVPFGVDYWL